jgi:hypothetical protein
MPPDRPAERPKTKPLPYVGRLIFQANANSTSSRISIPVASAPLLMSTLLMFLASPQNTAVSAEFCWLSSRGMFIGNGGLNKHEPCGVSCNLLHKVPPYSVCQGHYGSLLGCRFHMILDSWRTYLSKSNYLIQIAQRQLTTFDILK